MKLNTFHGPSKKVQAALHEYIFSKCQKYPLWKGKYEFFLASALKLTFWLNWHINVEHLLERHCSQQGKLARKKGKLYIMHTTYMKTSLFMHAQSRKKEEKCFPTKKLIADHDVGEAILRKAAAKPNFSFLDREKFNLVPTKPRQTFYGQILGSKIYINISYSQPCCVTSSKMTTFLHSAVATSKVQTDRI